MPAASTTDDAFRPRSTVPVPQPFTATLQVVAPVWVGGATVQPVAVPVRVKSAADSPLIPSEKARVQIGGTAAVGDAGPVRSAVAGVRSIVTRLDVTAAGGPAFDDRSRTEAEASVSPTEPSPQPVTWTVQLTWSARGCGVPIVHPPAVPLSDRSPAVRPVICSLKTTVAVGAIAFVGLAGIAIVA